MEIENLVLPLLIGVISSYLTYFFTLRSKKLEVIAAFKEKAYGNLLLKVQSFLDLGVTQGSESKKDFYEEIYKSWLYSSDDVVLAINRVVEFSNLGLSEQSKDPGGHKALGELVVAIRKDLLGKTRLGYEHFKYRKIAN